MRPSDKAVPRYTLTSKSGTLWTLVRKIRYSTFFGPYRTESRILRIIRTYFVTMVEVQFVFREVAAMKCRCRLSINVERRSERSMELKRSCVCCGTFAVALLEASCVPFIHLSSFVLIFSRQSVSTVCPYYLFGVSFATI